jgi:hypothetical protein
MKNRVHKYVCGYRGDRNCVYGKPRSKIQGRISMHNPMWIDPMTLTQAQRYADKANKLNNYKGASKMQVFELKLIK